MRGILPTGPFLSRQEAEGVGTQEGLAPRASAAWREIPEERFPAMLAQGVMLTYMSRLRISRSGTDCLPSCQAMVAKQATSERSMVISARVVVATRQVEEVATGIPMVPMEEASRIMSVVEVTPRR